MAKATTKKTTKKTTTKKATTKKAATKKTTTKKAVTKKATTKKATTKKAASKKAATKKATTKKATTKKAATKKATTKKATSKKTTTKKASTKKASTRKKTTSKAEAAEQVAPEAVAAQTETHSDTQSETQATTEAKSQQGDAGGDEERSAGTKKRSRRGRGRGRGKGRGSDDDASGTDSDSGEKSGEKPRTSGRGSGERAGGKKPLTRMIVDYIPGGECRIAITENGRLEEFDAERPSTATSVGNIYVGTVTNVESAIQAAFVDFGHESNGFLHISDLHPRYFPGEGEETTEKIGRKTPRRERPPIQQCLKRGQQVLVQVLKEGVGTKGPTVSSYLSIPGRHIVMLPDMDQVGVSRKVEDEDIRRKGRKILDSLDLPEGFGFILRTAGLDQTKTELKRDLAYLKRLWSDIEARMKKAKGKKPKRGDMASRLLYAEGDLLMRVLRDQWTSEVDEIIIDHPAALSRVARFMKIVAPRSDTKLLHYDSAAPIFHAFEIEEQIQRMHQREVPLPSGGSLVIDETEAMVAIDVNSGRMRSHGDSETTAFETNKEALEEICRQLRLRDVGGLVVCDMIDMMKRSHRREIERRFEERLKRDRAASRALPISQFGIVEMTRQRQRGSLSSMHFSKCPHCAGKGLLRRPSSVASDAMRDIAALLEHKRVASLELVVAPRVAGEMLSSARLELSRLEHRTGKSVAVRVSEDIQADRVVFYAYDEQGADIAIDKLPKPRPPKNLKVWDDGELSEEERMMLEQDDTSMLEELETEADANEALLDAVAGSARDLSAGEGEGPSTGAAHAEEESGEGGGRKRRRRRRGGRGRRRGGEGEGEGEEGSSERSAEAAAHAPTDEEAIANVVEATHDPSDSAEGEGEGEGDGERRRRRRRRGGRGRRRGEVETEAGAPTAEREERSERGGRGGRSRSRDEDIEADDGTDIPPADMSERGDSWDLTPEEFDAKYPRPNRRTRTAVHKPEPKPEPKRVTESVAEPDPAQRVTEPPKEEGLVTESGARVIKKKRVRKGPAKRAAAKEANSASVTDDDAPTPVVPKRSLFGSRRSTGR